MRLSCPQPRPSIQRPYLTSGHLHVSTLPQPPFPIPLSSAEQKPTRLDLCLTLGPCPAFQSSSRTPSASSAFFPFFDSTRFYGLSFIRSRHHNSSSFSDASSSTLSIPPESSVEAGSKGGEYSKTRSETKTKKMPFRQRMARHFGDSVR